MVEDHTAVVVEVADMVETNCEYSSIRKHSFILIFSGRGMGSNRDYRYDGGRGGGQHAGGRGGSGGGSFGHFNAGGNNYQGGRGASNGSLPKYPSSYGGGGGGGGGNYQQHDWFGN